MQFFGHDQNLKFHYQIIIELIIFMKMSDSQYQTFGCVYPVQETTEQVNHPGDSPKNMKSKPFNMNSSFDSYQDHLNSSSMFYKNVGGHDRLNCSDAVTNYTQKGSLRGITTWGLVGLSKDRDIDDDRTINRQNNLAEKTQLKKLTEKDEFLCNCVQQNKSDINCIACRGKKYADGNSNMVKFIEYIMQFKSGKRGVYQNQRMVKKSCQWQSEKRQEGAQKSNKMLSFDNVNMKNNQIFQKKGVKQPKQKISLVSKNRVTQSDTIRDQKNHNISNEHCRQFYMQHNKGDMEKSANKYEENFAYNKQENERSESYSNFKQAGFNTDKTRVRNNTINGVTGNQTTFPHDTNRPSYQKQKFSLTRTEKIQSNNRNSMYNIPVNSSSVMLKSSSITENPRQSIKSAKICKNIKQLKQEMCKQPMVHLNFSCDNCNIQPIIGIRYHCNSVMCWNDYDLCEKCYKQVGHDHSMVANGHSGEAICKKIQKICLNIKNIGKKVDKADRISLNYVKQECLESPSMIFKSSIH